MKNEFNNYSGWISTKDKLPDILENVLVFSKSYGVWIGARTSTKHGFMLKDDLGYVEDITHWMPFPEPPTNETTETKIPSNWEEFKDKVVGAPSEFNSWSEVIAVEDVEAFLSQYTTEEQEESPCDNCFDKHCNNCLYSGKIPE